MDLVALRSRYERATAGIDPPLAIVDLDALRANISSIAHRAVGKPVRLASKSVRCRHLLAEALDHPDVRGVLAFTLPEALWLAVNGTSDDIVVAYPTADREALARLAEDERLATAVTLMIDDVAHLDLIDAVAGSRHTPLRVCLDVDASWQVLGGRVRVGARRSPIRTPGQAAALARQVVRRDGVELVGVMAYEGQIAGVGDSPPGRPLYGGAIRWIQARSATELAGRRAEIVAAVRDVAPLEFVNGGGTGSLERTAAEPAVTEVAAGSGVYAPTLFDTYRAFRHRPAALFAAPVVRRPGPGVATVLGGGYIASGTAGADRLPQPFLPGGLTLDPMEGAGEVQTPLLGDAADGLAVGDRVWFRHAKAGELCERFDALHLVEGDRVTSTEPTYRGEGKAFL